MQNKTALTLISTILIFFLLFQSLHPYGYFYSYLHPQEQETTTQKKKNPTIVIPFSGLSPQKVSESNSYWATGDTHQSKVFFNNHYFFVFFYYGLFDGTSHSCKYATSNGGRSWDVKTLSILPFVEGLAANLDVLMKNETTCYIGFIYNKLVAYTARGDIADSTITCSYLWGTADIPSKITKSKANLRPDGRLYVLVHKNNNALFALYVPDPWAVGTRYNFPHTVYFSESSGGVQLVNYRTSSPYDMLALVKQGTDNVLYYAILHENMALDAPAALVTLVNGFSSFSVATEALKAGDPERVHLVYIKSSGELCYRKFENDAWSSEEVLVSEGASYPVIAVGKGKLYVFYVKDGIIYLLQKTSAGWQTPFPYYTWEHTYNNPVYLSTNQNVQNGKICLVWTEGTEAPYEVWFSYIND